jgi:GDP-4-dehydro-6-deoxy-D-mannose reductase
MYGRVRPSQLPISEHQPLNPVSPYAISKAAADLLAATYHCAYGLPIIRVRAFNHAGPRQRTGFVIPDFAAQIARLEKRSGKRVLRTGNLSARRDITDVRDVARAYHLLAERGKIGEVYHIGAGNAVSIKAILNLLVSMAERPILTVPDPRRIRPIEVPVLKADIRKMERLGWRPTIPLKQTLADTLDYYRSRE